MGRNKQDKGKGTLPNRELFERMSFLYQSSHFFAHLLPHQTTNDSSSDASSSSPVLPIARFFTKEMRQVARKSVLRISPHIKREICKSCASPLVPGVSCTTRIKGHKKGRRVVTTCLYCGCQRRLIADPHHELFVDQDAHGTIH